MNNAVITTEETMNKKDFHRVELQTAQPTGGMRLAISNYAELEKFASLMAISNFVPKHLRGKPADCVAVALQAMRWEMDPFSVAGKTYFVNDGIGYEAQLVNAIIISRAPIKGRPKFSWSGEGENLKCTASATFIGEDEPTEYEAELKTITTRNSPLWKQQPRQQLAYFALRAWARLYCPDVIMGVYTREEVQDSTIDITPREEGGKADEINALLMNESHEYDPETGEVKDPLTTDQAQQTQAEDATSNPSADPQEEKEEPLVPLTDVDHNNRTAERLKFCAKNMVRHLERTNEADVREAMLATDPTLLKELADKGLGRSHGDKIRKLLNLSNVNPLT